MTFHIPNQFRIRKGFMASTEANGNNGAFFIPSYPGKAPFKVVASDGGLEDGQIAWEHVSVSLLIRRSLVRAQVGEPKFSSEINGLQRCRPLLFLALECEYETPYETCLISSGHFPRGQLLTTTAATRISATTPTRYQAAPSRAESALTSHPAVVRARPFRDRYGLAGQRVGAVAEELHPAIHHERVAHSRRRAVLACIGALVAHEH